MQTNSESTQPSRMNFPWIPEERFEDADQARRDLEIIWSQGIPADLLGVLRENLCRHFEQLDDLDSALSNLRRFIVASRSPTALLALFERDSGALPAMLQVFATSQTLANRLIADPESFDLMRASDGQPAHRRYLVDELTAELRCIESPNRASLAIRKFTSREIVRIAYGEFVRNLSPDHVGRQLAFVCDAVIEAGLEFVIRKLTARHGQPTRNDGHVPEVCVIGLGAIGGEEMGYGAPMQLIFLYDEIEEKNASHKQFYSGLVSELTALVATDENASSRNTALGMEIDTSMQPLISVAPICSVDSAIAELVRNGRTWHRMAYVKARFVAGSETLAENFVSRLQPWIYRKFLSRQDFADVRTLRMKLQRRAEINSDIDHTDHDNDVQNAPGGRADIELAVQFLQLLHGGELESVRIANTSSAIVAFQNEGCLTHQESTLLASNHARLCRLQHQLSVLFGRSTSVLPNDDAMLSRLAWQLGIRSESGNGGDLERFREQLEETFSVNRRMINHLIVDVPHPESQADDDWVSETELILDPQPDPDTVRTTLSRHGFVDLDQAMENLHALSSESVRFLSARRCRHFLAAIAPTLLAEISQTPDPDETLATLVRVTDSIGGKASLWELLGANRPTMKLMVRLCAATPYLSQILIKMPGMIDELIDSLLMNRLPSKNRLDAMSIELCRGATDIDLILQGFKNSAHLKIGTRDMLGLEPIESTHEAISDTAEACVRRVAEYEQEQLALQFGDPVDRQDQPAELLAIALGKFGGREPNYHSDLDVVFLYSAEGETKRRVGGPRRTTTNQHFFNSMTQRIIARVNTPANLPRLYELDGRLRPTGEEGLLAVSLEEFLKRFRQGIAPLWQRLALCKARVISGSRQIRQDTADAIIQLLMDTQWRPSMAGEIREIRTRMQQTADIANIKRGEGGTVDVEFISQMLTLQHVAQTPQILQTGTTKSLQALADAGYLSEKEALQLITNYRVLRGIEGNLRLLNTPARHELPTSQSDLENLAFLMGEPDPKMILALVKQTRSSNRRIFDAVFDAAES